MAAKSKISQEQWDKAKLLFEAGEKVLHIEEKTGINRGSISRKAKSEEWVQGLLQHAIVESVRVKEVIATLTPPQQDFVAMEVSRILDDTKLIQSLTHLNLRGVEEELLQGEKNLNERLIAQTIIGKAAVDLGVQQKFATTIINNTNAQQTNGDGTGTVNAFSWEILPVAANHVVAED
jgi:hypothetical protein